MIELEMPGGVEGSADGKNTGMSERGSSYYGVFSDCPRKFFLKHRAKVKGRGAAAPALGSLVHEMLAYTWARKKGEDVPPLEETVARVVAEKEIPEDDVQLAYDIHSHYLTHPVGRTWRPIAVEKEYRMALVPQADGSVTWEEYDVRKASARGQTPTVGSHILYTARIDLVVENPDGKVDFVDHKTSWKVGPTLFLMYALSLQFAGQRCLGLFHLGQRFRDTWISGIATRTGRKIETRPAEPAPRFAEDFSRKVVSLAIRIAEYDRLCGMNERLWDPAMSISVCYPKFGLCEYASRCMTGR